MTPTPESDVERRFWPKVDRSGGRFACWPWTAAKQRHGYGIFGVDGRSRLAHRVAYILVRGDVPDGLVLDHLCRNRACCNPDHMEPVSNSENILRGISPTAINSRRDRCPHGHPYTPENTDTRADGARRCLPCRERSNAERRDCPTCGMTFSRASLRRHEGRFHRVA